MQEGQRVILDNKSKKKWWWISSVAILVLIGGIIALSRSGVLFSKKKSSDEGTQKNTLEKFPGNKCPDDVMNYDKPEEDSPQGTLSDKVYEIGQEDWKWILTNCPEISARVNQVSAETNKPASKQKTTTGKTVQSSDISSDNSIPDNSSSSGSTSDSLSSIPTQPQNTTEVVQAKPVLYLPISGSPIPDSIMPMGETINHPKPQNPNGHPGIDFQWNNPASIPEILASMEGTVTAIRESETWVGTYDVATKNGRYGVDYTELGGVKTGLKVGDEVKAGDLIGYPQHPSNITDQPNYRMIHWQFGYVDTNNSENVFVRERLCPMTYFDSSAKSSIETIWANTNWLEMKANAPDICSGDYAGQDS